MVSIFIAQTTKSVHNFEKFIRENQVKDCYLINPNNLDLTFISKTSGIWTSIISSGHVPLVTASYFSNVNYELSKLRALRKLIKTCNSEIPYTDKYKIYLLHIDEIISNYFFFSFRKITHREFYLIEEGTANYSPYYGRKFGRLQKVFLANLFKIRTRFFFGNYTAIQSKKVKAQYVHRPDLAYMPEKSLPLPYDPIIYDSNPNTILILGQEIYMKLIGQELYEEAFCALLDAIKKIISDSSNHIKIFYKKHPTPVHIDIKRHFESRGLKFISVESSEPIELVVSSLKPEMIFSFNSSALFNIAIALPANTKVKVYAFSYIEKKKNDVEMLELYKTFERVGIKLL